MKKLLFKHKTILLLILFSVPPGWAQPAGGPPPALVNVVPVLAKTMAPTRTVPAFSKAKYVTTIKAETNGRITEMAGIGSVLSFNDSLGIIADDEYTLRSNELLSAIKSNRASLEYLQAEAARLNSLSVRNLTSSSALEKNDSDLKIAKADLAQSESRLQQLQNNINKLTLAAPFDGFVSEHYAQPGQWVNAGQDILQYMSSNDSEIIANIPIKYKHLISTGQQWQFADQTGQIYNASIQQFIPAATSSSRQIRIHLTSPDAGLLPGEAVSLFVPESAAKEVLAIPRDALVLRRDGAYVFIIRDNIAHKVDVTTGIAQGDLIEAIGQLKADDMVVIRGNERLRDQQNVQINTTE